jgi:hypothetical protein
MATSTGVHKNNVKSWLAKIFRDLEHRAEADQRENSAQPREGDVTALFEVKTTDACHQFRPVQIGRNHNRDNALIMPALEVFGCFID